MLTHYIQAAMNQASYDILDDGTYYGEIQAFPGSLPMRTHWKFAERSYRKYWRVGFCWVCSWVIHFQRSTVSIYA